MSFKKLWAMILAVVMIGGVALTGCGAKDEDEGTVGEAQEQSEQQEEQNTEFEGEKVLDYYLSSEPQTLDPQQMWGQPDLFVENMFMEGLLRFGKDDSSLEPGVAKGYTYDEATNTYTFELREDAKWADGTPVTADDFFFAWRNAIDTSGAYSFLIYEYIEGADEYAAYDKSAFLTEKDPSFADLSEEEQDARIENMTEEELNEFQAKKDELWNNVKAVAEGNNIKITVGVPAPYFPSLTAFAVYAPAREDFYNEKMASNEYGIEATGLMGNGPWKVEEWAHNDYFKLVKNENYWNKDNINIDVINLKIVDNVETRTNLLKTGKLDGSAIQANDVPDFEDMATLNELNLQPLINRPDFAVFYTEFNHNDPIMSNANIRKAIMYAMDRTSFVEKINIGDEPALAVIPKLFPGLEKTFREENGMELFEDNNKEKAKEYLEAGLEELGMTELPAIDFLIGDSDIEQKIAEKFQADWKEIGINVNLIPLPWGERLSRLQSGDFAMSSSGWGPDYPDAMTFLDLFQTGNPNNSGGYSNPDYDKLIEAAKTETDPAKRIQYMYDAEKILIEDAVIAPQYFRNVHFTFKNYVSGVVIRGVGSTTDFYWADIDMAAKNAEQE
ncbi:peptide ABC transporter substrate-binding protein [Defluviitalea phaphyphila]|uniref:peptide ABC transporter substrate-binding protein n=1 Tax=Defluviitalea phaphyphila TaxID=1473580 RepID=UPI0007303B93|nr:peptide ABC transporter substrate-binding protein [Defluviitalea phaphyphila]